MSANLHPELRETVRDGPLATPGRVLAVGAHPDDVEFGAGGTLARWAGEGAHITVAVVTDGSKGTWDRSVAPAALAETRRREQAEAAAVMGAAQVAHLDHIDGELEYSMDLRREMCALIRRVQPDVVLSHDPWQRYQLHPDHRATGLAVVDGVVAARDHLFFPDLGPAHRPGHLLLWSADVPDHLEPVDATLDTKVAALLCHSSQATTTMGGADEDDDARELFATHVRTAAEAAAAGSAHTHVEAFKKIVP